MNLYKELFNRKNLVVIKTITAEIFDPKKSKRKDALLASMQKNLLDQGYILGKDALDKMSIYSIEFMYQLYEVLMSNIMEKQGSSVSHNVMYPNFPRQVMDADSVELFLNATLHYLTHGQWSPKYEKKEIPELIFNGSPKVIHLGTEADIIDIATSLLESNVSISENDAIFIRTFLNDFELPEIDIPFKENIAIVGAALFYKEPKQLKKLIKTPTDLLRVITELSSGDISLSSNTKFKKFNRPDRKKILKLINGFDFSNLDITWDFIKNKNRWLRIGEIIHPGEYSYRYENAAKIFEQIRGKSDLKKYSLEFAIKNMPTPMVIEYLSAQPSEFFRKMDYIISRTNFYKQNPSIFHNMIQTLAPKVSNRVLLQVYQHFINRESNHEHRLFLIKGSLSRTYIKDNDLPKIESKVIQEVLKNLSKVIRINFANKKSLGKVFIEKSALSNFTIPFSQRSASNMSNIYPRGSILNIDGDSSIVRFFVHWVGKDIDLTATFLNSDFAYESHISYTQMKKYGCCHSGDITSAHRGASEFIDIDIDALLDVGIQYVSMNIYSFSKIPLNKVENLFCGWMERNGTGEIYEPKTVKNKIELNSSGYNSIVLILNLKKRKVMYLDLDLPAPKHNGNMNIENTQYRNTLLLKNWANIEMLSLYNLLDFNSNRFEEVDSACADLLFVSDKWLDTHKGKDEAKIVTPHDIEFFSSELM